MKEHLIENFLSQESCDYITSYLNNSGLLFYNGRCTIYINKESGTNAVCDECITSLENGIDDFPYAFQLMNHFKNNKLQNSLIFDLINLVTKNMCTVFGWDSSEYIYETSHYTCFGTDINTEEGLDIHYDHYGKGGKIYTAVLYLNDNYEGGKVTFYDENHGKFSNPRSFSPKAGSLIYFHGETFHSVENVYSGNRACIVLHVRKKEKDQ